MLYLGSLRSLPQCRKCPLECKKRGVYREAKKNIHLILELGPEETVKLLSSPVKERIRGKGLLCYLGGFGEKERVRTSEVFSSFWSGDVSYIKSLILIRVHQGALGILLPQGESIQKYCKISFPYQRTQLLLLGRDSRQQGEIIPFITKVSHPVGRI